MGKFEEATREKIRFESPQGVLSVEDIWDLPLTGSRANLDDIAKGLYKKIRESDTESFVRKSTGADKILQLKFDIVKHIIEVRLTEAEAAEKAQANKEKKQRIMAIMAQKEDEALSGKSMKELRKLASEL